MPGGPATNLPAFYLRLLGTNDDHVDPNITCSRAIHKPPHQQHHRDFSFQPPLPSLPTPGYMRQRRLTPHPARALLAPALTDGDPHPLHTPPNIQFRGDSTPAPMACFPLKSPRTCCSAPHGPGCAFDAGRVLPTRRVGEAAIRLERRAAKQNERPFQQVQGVVRLPGAAATPAHTYTHPTPARQSWMSACRHIQSPPLSEVAFPLVCPPHGGGIGSRQ